MGCDDDNGIEEKWMRQDGLYCHEKDSGYDVSPCTWNEVSVNQQDLSYMLNETTPVKAYGDLAYHVHHQGSSNKEPEERSKTSSHLKRQRMLQFDAEVVDSPFCDEELDSFLQPNGRKDSLEEVLSLVPQWNADFQAMSASSYEGQNPQPQGRITECLNNADVNLSPDEMSLSKVSDIQIDISEFCSDPPACDTNVVQRRVTRKPQNIVVKGRKCLIWTATKLTSSVAYPFAFLKPSAFRGDVTLKDINQWISTPSHLKSKKSNEDPGAYPTSAFSGKPVVGKTKIRTGGKGSITIMRTKG